MLNGMAAVAQGTNAFTSLLAVGAVPGFDFALTRRAFSRMTEACVKEKRGSDLFSDAYSQKHLVVGSGPRALCPFRFRCFQSWRRRGFWAALAERRRSPDAAVQGGNASQREDVRV